MKRIELRRIEEEEEEEKEEKQFESLRSAVGG